MLIKRLLLIMLLLELAAAPSSSYSAEPSSAPTNISKIEKAYSPESLVEAAKDRNLNRVDLLLQMRMDVNAVPAESRIGGYVGRSALHWAVANGDMPMVLFLLSKGADVRMKAWEMFGDTSLHIAVKSGHSDLAKILIANGADINAVSGYGTPLFYSTVVGDKPFTDLLLSKGADPNASAPNGIRPLHNMAQWRLGGDYEGVIDLLIAKGADINAKDKDGKTPLDYALKMNDRVAGILSQRGAMTTTR